MTDQSTIDEITNWATNKYASSASPSLTAATAPAATTPTETTGMLGAAAPDAGSTAPGAAAAAPASTWADATKPASQPALGAANMPATTSTMGGAAAPAGTSAPPVNSAPGSWASVNMPQTKRYNGQDVFVGEQEMGVIKDAADSYNRKFGTNLSAQEYDKMYNPTTYGARWGIPESGAGTGEPFQTHPAIASGPTLLDPASLAQRTIDQKNETVRGQLGQVLAEDSPVLQQARADAMRAANERGMLNSTMATSGAEDAVIRSAIQIANPDAAAFGHAADYNAAAANQAKMFNSTSQNDFARQKLQLDADKAAQAANLASQASLQDKQLGQQMTVAQMQDATSRFATEANNSTSKYNTDAQYKQQADNNKKTLTNNILQNMDLSPDRKAAMLEQLGEGTSAKRNPDGSIVPGTGLAGAVYVIDSVSADLNFGGNAGGVDPNYNG